MSSNDWHSKTNDNPRSPIGSNLPRGSCVAHALGDELKHFTFVGGAATALYIDDPAAPDVRPTNDIDCAVETVTYTAFSDLERRLRNLGFTHHPHGPICRWIVREIVVDIMPTQEGILSKDIEDVLAVFDGRKRVAAELVSADDRVRAYLQTTLSALNNHQDRDEILSRYFDTDEVGGARAQRARALIELFVAKPIAREP